ncbi:hypothetical protein FACS1894208_00300 [Clostridia bacterium]|nr:hypothetical protein FACS1894208_00300 [Clostridia bacterium]
MRLFCLMNGSRPLVDFSLPESWQIDLHKQYGDLPGVMRTSRRHWIAGRIRPSERVNIAAILGQFGADTPEKFLTLTRAISYTDTLWVNSYEFPATWEEVNPYTNRLSDVISRLALYGVEEVAISKTPSPDYEVDGAVEKAWMRWDGMVCLAKTGGEFNNDTLRGFSPLIEYYAGQVVSAICGSTAKYAAYAVDSHRSRAGQLIATSYCPAFTDEKQGYAPYFASAVSVKVEDLALSGGGLSRTFRTMLLIDAVIMNTDRHTGNYGFIMDNSSMRITGVAPIFDHDRSLGRSATLFSGSKERAYEAVCESDRPRTFRGKNFVEQGELVLDKKLRNSLRAIYPFKFVRPTCEANFTDLRVDFMTHLVNTQIRRILRF